MRKLHQGNQDSLDMLLDTLCNVFGSIILISCLLAMLSGKGTPSPRSPVVDTETQALQEVKLQAARGEMEGLRKLLAEMEVAAEGKRTLIEEREGLLKTVERLRRAKNEWSSTDNSTDKADDIAGLLQEHQAAGKLLADAKAKAQIADEKRGALESHLGEITLQLEQDVPTETVRFPRERKTAKGVKPVILRYDEIFPLLDGQGNFTPHIKRTPQASGGFTTQMTMSEGLNLSSKSEQLFEILHRYAAGNNYVSIYVYPDSFATFRELKRRLHELKLDYGLQLCREHQVLLFDPNGYAPPPL